MTRSRKVLLLIIALAVLADFLPVTRDEFSWWWAQSRDHAADYLGYLSDWPKGRHVAEARVFCEQRQWAETKRAQIREAYAAVSHTNSDTDAAYRLQRRTQRENFLWQQATNVNTVAIYNDYLRQFPQGLHAAEGRQKIEALGRPAPAANPAAPQ
jgi:hypothetical protein